MGEPSAPCVVVVLGLAMILFATVGFGRSQRLCMCRSAVRSRTSQWRTSRPRCPDGEPGFRKAAYEKRRSATSLLREPTTEPFTTIGWIIEIALRLLGPLLLSLAVLALRGR